MALNTVSSKKSSNRQNSDTQSKFFRLINISNKSVLSDIYLWHYCKTFQACASEGGRTRRVCGNMRKKERFLFLTIWKLRWAWCDSVREGKGTKSWAKIKRFLGFGLLAIHFAHAGVFLATLCTKIAAFCLNCWAQCCSNSWCYIAYYAQKHSATRAGTWCGRSQYDTVSDFSKPTNILDKRRKQTCITNWTNNLFSNSLQLYKSLVS